MRKLFLLFAAALVIASCNNLKKPKDKDSDDTEETTTKKKKDKADDDATDDTKKKKNNDDEDYTPKKDTDTDYNTGWSTSDKNEFMDECVGAATPNVGKQRAQEYCSCTMEKIQKQFSSLSDANTKA